MAENKMFLELILMQQILFKTGRDEKELAVLSYKYFFLDSNKQTANREI